jgi:glycosyltransferase involved in cell wall biosynthesis
MRGAGCDASIAVRGREGSGFYRERGVIFLHNGLSRKNLFDVSIANTGIPVTKLPAFREADVIHLHWINQGMLSVKEIKRILASGKKVLWTMHDMWPVTGICHYAGECGAFASGCRRCPYINSLARSVFRKKQAAYSAGGITFVACSDWLKDLAAQSPLTEGHRLLSIPNPIDTETYRPMDRKAVREKLNLPLDKKIVLFAAVKASDKRKGTDYLREAGRLLAYRSDLLFLIAGSGGEEIEMPLPAKSVGYVPQQQMPELYNAADLFVTPSLCDNLPNTVMEAMACGTPCVGFRTGGIPEMIAHGENGYVAHYKDAADLAQGIWWALRNDVHAELSLNARQKVLDEYAQEKVAQRYLEIYEQ